MKIPLTILALVALTLGAFYLFTPAPDPADTAPRTDLPWQVKANPDGTSRVFDLDLGSATLADAMAKFGGLEGLALFEPNAGPLVLEAYFGNVRLGPLNAKVIVGLAAGDDELATVQDRATRREGSPSGDWKYPLGDAPKLHLHRRLRGITYIPGTRDLDSGFFRERFGEPAAVRRESDTVVSWFYPGLGLSVLIDDDAREVLEYRPPRDFALPTDARPARRGG